MSRHYRKYDLHRVKNVKYSNIEIPFTLYSLIATVAFIGKIRFMSGTFGSLAFYPIFYYALYSGRSNDEVITFFTITAIILFFIGLWSITQFQKITNSFDHYSVVIDELIGMSVLFTCCFKYLDYMSLEFYKSVGITSYNLNFLIGFLVFRFFDIYKPFFIRHVDRYYKGPVGVILDDILAAFMGAGFIYVAYLILEKIGYL